MADLNELVNKGLEGLEGFLHDIRTNPEIAAELNKPKPGNPITLGPSVPTATDWVNDMTAAAKAKADKWLKNSKAPSKDPKAEAKKAVTKYENNMRASLDEKRWPAGIDAYDEAGRMTSIDQCGTSGFTAGIDRKKHKAQKKIEKLQPLVVGLKEKIGAMAVGTDPEREARMLAARRGMIAIGKEMRKG